MAGLTFLLFLFCLTEFQTFVASSCYQDVHPMSGFDPSQLEGIWYTKARTERHLQSAVRNYELTDNINIHFAFTFFHPRQQSCITPIDHILYAEGTIPGEYSLHYGIYNASIKFVYTSPQADYALAYACILRPDGSCSKIVGEILSKSSGPIPDNIQQTINTLIETHGCLQVNQFRAALHNTLCNVPHLSERKKRNAGNMCEMQVDDVPIVTGFSMSQMSGVWYEIARTRFTFNQMESGVFNYIYNSDSHRLAGLYSGTKAGICQPAFPGQSKRRSETSRGSDLLARIGGDNSLFPWSPFKIVHSDEDSILFYACYLVKDDGTCARDRTEVTLVSRTRELSDTRREEISLMLSGLCLNPDHLIVSDTTVDCTEFALGERAANLPDVSACIVDAIPVQENFDVSRFLGDWYVLGTVEYGQRIHHGAAFVRFSAGARDYVWESAVHSSAAGECEEERHYMFKPRCSSTRNGDYLTTFGSGMRSQWTSLKILFTDYNHAVVYTCTKENLDGTCDATGISIRFLSRQQAVDDNTLQSIISTTLPSVCASPFDMQRLPVRVSCFDRLAAMNMPSRLCDVENIRVQIPYVDQIRLSGLWYELARTRDPVFTFDSSLIYYRVESTGFLSVRYAGRSPQNSRCFLIKGTTRPRCINTINGEYLGRMQMPGQNMWVTWKMLFSDYHNYAVAYSCVNTNNDGTCSPSGTKLHVLSRGLHRLTHGMWNHIYSIVSSACIDPVALEYVQYTTNCTQLITDSL